jgi:DNA-binding NarL/FixJ family response regulator
MSHDDAQPFVLLVEDEVLVRITLTRIVEGGGFSVIAVASAEEALEVLDAVPEIKAVITDVNLSSSGINGFELARKIWSERRIGGIVVTGHASPEGHELPPGIHFLGKPLHRSTLIHLVRDAVNTSSQRLGTMDHQLPAGAEAGSGSGADQSLTRRQHEVLALLVQGKANREIAQALDIAENTVKVHLAAIFRVLGVSSRTEALLVGSRRLQLSGEPAS